MSSALDVTEEAMGTLSNSLEHFEARLLVLEQENQLLKEEIYALRDREWELEQGISSEARLYFWLKYSGTFSD